MSHFAVVLMLLGLFAIPLARFWQDHKRYMRQYEALVRYRTCLEEVNARTTMIMRWLEAEQRRCEKMKAFIGKFEK